MVVLPHEEDGGDWLDECKALLWLEDPGSGPCIVCSTRVKMKLKPGGFSSKCEDATKTRMSLSYSGLYHGVLGPHWEK